MQRIQLLPPTVAERIAAGEVIERPASVVKELVENALDAGATEIAVILKDGGRELIEIIDNGSGMGREDLAISVLRHATSKIRSLDDLEQIRTLGFRGEALPSVAAVSQMKIVSRAKGSDTAYELDASAPTSSQNPVAVTFGHFLGSEHGSAIKVESIFSQIPARLKFLKAPGAEVSFVRDWLERLALTRPDVGFHFSHNDKSLFRLRPQTPEERIQQTLSEGDDLPVVSADSASLGSAVDIQIRVRAYWLHGFSAPHTRRLYQVVNGRVLKDRMLQHAMLTPFRQALLPGQFPALYLNIEIDPSELDVNVHPTKTEVRFLHNSKVYHLVQSTLQSLVMNHGAPSIVAGPRAWVNAPAPNPALSGPSPRVPTGFAGKASNFGDAGYSGALSPVLRASEWRPASMESAQETISFTAEPPATALGAPPNPLREFFRHAHYQGVIFRTYLLFENEAELGIIDQHAAHERIRFERLKRGAFGNTGEGVERQALLMPETVSLRTEDREKLETRLPWLESLGFEAEIFGEGAVLFRSVPAAWGADALKARLKALVERVLETETTEAGPLALDERLFEKLASEACHSAIRAGDRVEPVQARALVDELFACEHPWNCPHGRPTIVKISEARIEEWFHRRV
ncbi:MAG: DNA mismatch repair endonuclease MutL [Bacteriovoracia bacterium]